MLCKRGQRKNAMITGPREWRDGIGTAPPACGIISFRGNKIYSVKQTRSAVRKGTPSPRQMRKSVAGHTCMTCGAIGAHFEDDCPQRAAVGMPESLRTTLHDKTVAAVRTTHFFPPEHVRAHELLPILCASKLAPSALCCVSCDELALKAIWCSNCDATVCETCLGPAALPARTPDPACGADPAPVWALTWTCFLLWARCAHWHSSGLKPRLQLLTRRRRHCHKRLPRQDRRAIVERNRAIHEPNARQHTNGGQIK